MKTDSADFGSDREPRQNWRRNWLSCIQEFADFEQQKIKWLDPENTNPHWGYVEYMCCYFDDLGLSDRGYSWAESVGFVSSNEVSAVEEFHRTAVAHNSPTNDYDLTAILSDPKWLAVTEAAKRAQANLILIIDDEEEIQLLTTR